ncbi:MAG: hypothetical protein RRY29_07485, partial [Desulfovibrionaceae bacterium]
QLADVEAFKAYLNSGEFEDHFAYSPEDRRFEMLELLEKIMDLSDVADAVATRIIFKSGTLTQLTGQMPPKADPEI